MPATKRSTSCRKIESDLPMMNSGFIVTRDSFDLAWLFLIVVATSWNCATHGRSHLQLQWYVTASLFVDPMSSDLVLSSSSTTVAVASAGPVACVPHPCGAVIAFANSSIALAVSLCRRSAVPNKRTTTVVNQQNRVFSSLNATKTPEQRRTRPPSASCFENNKGNSDRPQPHPSPHPHLPHARAGSWKRGRARSAVGLWTETGSSRPPFEWGVAGRGG